jgi:hypothetical protein
MARMHKSTEIVCSVKKRKLEYFGHIMRHDKYRILQLVMQGKIEGKRGPGRRRTSWMKNLRDWFGQSSASLFRAATSKEQIALMVANLKETA